MYRFQTLLSNSTRAATYGTKRTTPLPLPRGVPSEALTGSQYSLTVMVSRALVLRALRANTGVKPSLRYDYPLTTPKNTFRPIRVRNKMTVFPLTNQRSCTYTKTIGAKS